MTQCWHSIVHHHARRLHDADAVVLGARRLVLHACVHSVFPGLGLSGVIELLNPLKSVLHCRRSIASIAVDPASTLVDFAQWMLGLAVRLSSARRRPLPAHALHDMSIDCL